GLALLSNERSRAVKIQIEKGKVDVTSSSPEIGEATETLPVDYSGTSLQICFNAQYVLDFLAAVATDVVSLELKDEVSQAVMKPVGAEGYDYTYVIMPLRVRCEIPVPIRISSPRSLKPPTCPQPAMAVSRSGRTRTPRNSI